MSQLIYDDTLKNSIKYIFLFTLSVPCIPIFMAAKFGFEFIELVWHAFNELYLFTGKVFTYTEMIKTNNKAFIRQPLISNNHYKRDNIILSKYIYAYLTGARIFRPEDILLLSHFFVFSDINEYKIFFQYHHTFLTNKSLYDEAIVQCFQERSACLFESASELRVHFFETKRKNCNIYNILYTLENYNVFSYTKLVEKIGHFYLSDNVRASYILSIRENPYLFHYYTRFNGVCFCVNSKF